MYVYGTVICLESNHDLGFDLLAALAGLQRKESPKGSAGTSSNHASVTAVIVKSKSALVFPTVVEPAMGAEELH
jgi:hypothetical protein